MPSAGFGAKIDVKLKVDKLKELAEKLKSLAQMEVYVGIPESASKRPGEEVNLAQLLFIHTNGSELRNIPKRPVIEPAIEAEDNKERITKELGDAARALLEGRPTAVKKSLHQAGKLGRDAAKNWFTDPRNNWPPDKRETIRRKLMKLEGETRKIALAAIYSNATSFMLDGEMVNIDTPLIDTAVMQGSIRYIVVEKGSVEEAP